MHCLAYPADLTHWFGGEAMSLFDRAKNVLNLMAAEGFGRRPIVFVCHSLGGLVVKQLLRQAADGADPDWQAIGKQTRAVVFVATPHAGADLARIAERLGMVTQTTPVMADLTAHAPALRGLNEWFRGYVRRSGLRVLSYYETRTSGAKRVGRLGRVVSAGVKVVEEADADPGVGMTPIPLDADHLGTCKPHRRDRPLCKDVLRLMREVVAEANSVPEAVATATPIATVAVGAQRLPADLPDFQGREDQIKHLKAILTADGGAAVTAVAGMGGVGKSALALHVAHQLADISPDGRIFVDMGGMSAQPLTPLAAMTRVIQALQPTAQVPPELDLAQSLYRSCLDGKRVLLLLDNAENTAQVAPLVEWRTPTTLLIVTARQTITAPGLKGLRLDVMDPHEARHLLRAVLAGWQASDNELDTLASRCGRLPLALRVAGTFLTVYRDWTIGGYLVVLADERQRLSLLKIEGDARLDVQAVLSLSARKLAEDNPMLAQRWRMLVVFPQSFDHAAAAAVWEAPEANTRRGLSEMVRRSMALYDEADGRYRLHDLMRDVARLPLAGQEKAVVERRLEAAAARHARHYCKVLVAAGDLYLTGGETLLAGLALYDLEQRNIAAGQAWAADRIQTSDDGARLAAAYADVGVHVLSLRLHRRVHIGWLEAQLTACRKLGDRRGEANALGNLGLVYADLGKPRRAIEYHEQDLLIAREIDDRRGEGGALGNLGLVYVDLGEPRRAIEYYEQGARNRARDRRPAGRGRRAGQSGPAYADLGEPRRAIEYHEQALAIAREIGDRRNEGTALGNLGNAYAALGDARRAIEYHEQDLLIAREIGDRQREGAALGNLGIAYKTLGDPRRAIEYYEQHVTIARVCNDNLHDRQATMTMAGLGRQVRRKL